jgi:hypothetical protein
VGESRKTSCLIEWGGSLASCGLCTAGNPQGKVHRCPQTGRRMKTMKAFEREKNKTDLESNTALILEQVR